MFNLFIDGIAEDEMYIYIVLPLFVIYTVLSLLGILFATVCLVFNLWFREQKYVYIGIQKYIDIIFSIAIQCKLCKDTYQYLSYLDLIYPDFWLTKLWK